MATLQQFLRKTNKRGASAPATTDSGLTLLATSNLSVLGVYYTDHNDDVLAYITFTQGGFTHHYIGGELRFIATALNGSSGGTQLYRAVEFKLPVGGFGGTVAAAQITNYWDDIFNTAGAAHHGITWNEAKGGLWRSQSDDYPDTGSGPGTDTGVYQTRCISFCTLTTGTPGTITNNVWPLGFEEVGQRALAGAVLATPSRWRSSYEFGPFIYAAGQYTSKVNQGYRPGLGLFLLSGPDATTYGAGSVAISSTDFDIVVDHRSGVSTPDPYSSYSGPGWVPSADRDWLITEQGNYYDSEFFYDQGGGSVQNPGNCTGTVNTIGTAVTLATGQDFEKWWVGYNAIIGGVSTSTGNLNITINSVQYPVTVWIDGTHLTIGSSAGTQTGVAYTGPTGRPVLPVPDAGSWQSPGPDSNNRTTWNFNISSGTALIEGLAKYAILSVVVTGTGSAYYNHSSLTYDGRACEIHLTDPSDCAEVIAATRDSWNVQAYDKLDITATLISAVGNDPAAFVGGQNFVYGAGAPVSCTFDDTTNYLWILMTGLGNGYKCALICIEVDCD